MGLFGLLRRKPHERTGFELYTAAVAAAREPALFAAGVPDTLEGRFEAISLHVGLLVHRLRHDPDPRGAPIAQAVFDAMFADMDLNLREMGVGDMSIGKRVKRLWENFHGRARAYEAAIAAPGNAAWEEALARNLWAGSAPEGAPARLAAHARVLEAWLAAQPFEALAGGRLALPRMEAA
ncbi:ubiquinol-cytochrome C chaperone [Roseomonas sp. OT10]|uniref:ubiquinol-cytochrome C chaperone family protein n=1 Tax=Roseomonas cutis TaxID=2897332 RepID=UPI001E3DD4F6|nr:ubiquinol-cytochrome C chaperone family protein [Roseomonas sp. OT10]UFN50671.1 ubiquinol-cytochrome C chaperone [Roseomonas sp. OT10]